jgi:20S proteasome alpha/beta subunit
VTAIVGIRCKNGVVIGADSSATFGDGGGNRFIEQSTRKKIEIIGESVIVAGTGSVGHMQHFTAVAQKLWNDKSFSGKSDLEIGKLLSSGGIATFTRLMQ